MSDRQSSNPASPDAGSLAFLSGGGEMGERIRARDWSGSLLGPPASWPQSLKTTVQLLLHARYPMFVWWGRDKINIYNDAYSAVLGQRHPEALGRPAAEVWSDIWETVGQQARTVMDEGQSTWSQEQLLVMERNGFVEETYFTYSYSPVLADDGSIGGVFCTCTEDTQWVIDQRRLRTLRALAEHAAEARTVEAAGERAAATLADNPHDLPFALIYLLDGSGSHARLSGHTRVEAGSTAAPERIDLRAADAPWPFQTAIDGGRAIEIDGLSARFDSLSGGAWPEAAERAVVLPLTRPGQVDPAGFLIAGVSPRRPLDDHYRGFLDLVAGQTATAVAHARAYEEERQRVEELAELDRAKTAFFSNVSHEFRTPLTLMLGPLEDALSDSLRPLDSENRERLELAHRNSLRLQRLVNTLLEFSRIEAGRADAAFEPTDLAALTADLASNFRSACERAGLAFEVECPPLPEPVYVDRQMWEKVVLNLLSNAFKFTIEGRIGLSLHPIEGAVELAISDTGPGVAPGDLPRLFERFHRAQGVNGRGQEGSGIGLALVRELVRLHGGEVRAESTLGEGATFYVTIPFGRQHLPEDLIRRPRSLAPTALDAAAYLEDVEPTTSSPATLDQLPLSGTALPESLPAPGDGDDGLTTHVLLVEDNQDMRDYIRRLLARDYRVTAVADGREALTSARRERPDLVLSDVMMPGLDGFELLRTLRGDAALRDIPLILLSARAGEEARIEGLQAGADDYLIKPFSARELLARVESQIAMAKLRREAASAIRDREAKLQRIVDNAPMGIAVLRGEDLVFASANPVYRAFRGEGVPIVGRSYRQVFPEAAAGGAEERLRAVIRTGEPWILADFHTAIPGRDELAWFEGQCLPLPNEHGEIDSVLALAWESTEHRRSQRELKRSEARFRALFESIDAGFCIVEMVFDERSQPVDYRFIEANPAFSRHTGIEGGIGRLAREAVPELEPFWVEIYGKVALTQEPVRFQHGSPAMGRVFDVYAFPVEEREKHQVGILFNDITEQKRTEEALRESEARFRNMADNAPVMIWMTNAQGQCAYLNQQWYRFTGTRTEEGWGLGWTNSVHPEDHALATDGFIGANRDRGPFRVEYRLRRHDGQYRWAIDSATPRVAADGEFLGYIGSVIDVHDLKQVEEKLREADRRKDEFLATLAHELRNPLAPIRTGLEILKLSRHDPERVEAVRRTMEQQTEQLITLVNDLLEVSRITRGKLEMRKQATALDDLVLRAVEGARPFIDEGGHQLTVDVPEQPVYLLADPHRLAQVLSNLLNNAAKYTPDGGRIHLSARRQDGEVLIAVRDTGVGLPAEMRERIFEMFAQIDRPGGTRGYTGLGIGLTLVKTLVEMHDGRVTVESPGPDQGSTFTVYLPVLDEGLEARPPAREHPTPPAARRVLIVDDNKAAADLLALVVEMLGHQPRTAGDGQEGIALAETFRPELVLMDLGMPLMDGYEAARHLRQQPWGRDIMLVALTGWGQAEDRERTRETGFDHHLVKPAGPPELETVFAMLEDRLRER